MFNSSFSSSIECFVCFGERCDLNGFKTVQEMCSHFFVSNIPFGILWLFLQNSDKCAIANRPQSMILFCLWVSGIIMSKLENLSP